MRGRELCAVCDSTNQTTAICDTCRADPANGDWCEGESRTEVGAHEDIADSDRLLRRLAELCGKRIYDLPPLHRRVVLLMWGGMEGTEEYRHPRRRAPVVRKRWRRVSARRIAREVGLSHTYVLRIWAKLWG